MAAGLPSLPRATALKEAEARVKCLSRFAHHELMAVELFAWALLRWPELPSELRADFACVLEDEQRHCQMYLDRLKELGGTFGAPPYSNYFWKHVPAISSSPHGPRAFLAAMGLTLEQANLDFTLVYCEGFIAAGDQKSAEILTQVHEDEINHVAMAARWMKRLAPDGSELVDAYREAVPFPLSAARAKAQRFDLVARRRAGLDENFIEFVRKAQSPQNNRSTPAGATYEKPRPEWSPLLYPNLGGEELSGATGAVITNATTPTLRLWRLLFGPDAHFLSPQVNDASCDLAATLNTGWWPEALGSRQISAAFPWLDDCHGIVPWIGTANLGLHPSLDEREISSAPLDAVARVHDKSFANDVAVAEDLLPDCMKDLFLALDPESLLDPDAAIRRMEDKIASWPEELSRNFTLKPRLGTSGRGRVPGVDGRVDSPAVRGALRRLAKRGGAILEPWFRRKLDLATQIYIAPNGEVTLLGTLEQVVAPSGVYLGHRAEIDSRGRVFSGVDYDETLRETAAIAARHAFAAGFFGPCGIDAFSLEMHDGNGAVREVLRPIVEFNARFTLGTIAVGLVRRALEKVVQPLDLTPGTRRAFYFGLDAPRGGWDHARQEICGKSLLIPLWHPADSVKPAILFAESREALDAVVADARKPRPKRKTSRKTPASKTHKTRVS